jgi:hypothetical protein
MTQPTVILLKLPSGSEVFLTQRSDTTLEGGIHCLTYQGPAKEGGSYTVYVPEPAVEEWEADGVWKTYNPEGGR